MKILCFGAHSDDVEMGMGATLSKLLREKHEVKVVIMSSAANKKGNEGIENEFNDSMKIYNVDAVCHKFDTDNFMHDYHAIKNTIYAYREAFKPDKIFCPSRNAMHTDHKVVAHACKAIFLEQTVLSYKDIRGGTEVLTRWYEEVSELDLATKLKALSCYRTQIEVQKRTYFDFDAIRSISRTEGLQCGCHLAEAFEVIRVINH